MGKETITLSSLLTLAVALLSLGIDLLRQGEYVPGTVCVVAGFGVACIGVYLFERGAVGKIKQAVEGCIHG